MRIEGPQRSLEVIVAEKRKTQISNLLRGCEKPAAVQSPDAVGIKIRHGFLICVPEYFPYYIHQSANVQSLFFTWIITKASLVRPVWSWGDRLKIPLTPGQFFTRVSR